MIQTRSLFSLNYHVTIQSLWAEMAQGHLHNRRNHFYNQFFQSSPRTPVPDYSMLTNALREFEL